MIIVVVSFFSWSSIGLSVKTDKMTNCEIVKRTRVKKRSRLGHGDFIQIPKWFRIFKGLKLTQRYSAFVRFSSGPRQYRNLCLHETFSKLSSKKECFHLKLQVYTLQSNPFLCQPPPLYESLGIVYPVYYLCARLVQTRSPSSSTRSIA
jgi:hypothetical protein